MNIHQNRKARQEDKQLPGCLGVMVNLFDVSAGLGGNRLLTDRPHQHGSPNSRSLSDVAVMVDPFNKDQIEDKKTDARRNSSNRKSDVTPIKMLIAQEMSNEVDLKQSPPNLVAKLMGLDALPINLPDSKSYLQQSRSLRHMRSRTDYPLHGRSFSDEYHSWQQYRMGNSKKENSSVNEKKMALVREKFMEAKRMAPDEKLRKSKEFRDAVEVLSSNRDFLLRFLQEPNYLIQAHIPSAPDSKRITILRPTKVVDNKFPSQGSGRDRSGSGYSSATQPTRIVVLKPSCHDLKLVGDNFFEEGEAAEIEETREVAREITRQIRENLTDETVVSSVFSNGYIGDYGSFNGSENEYYEGNLSDSEIISSWDFVDRVGSPFSTSSRSPESSVSKEAKKRLSERWTLMASKQSSLDNARKSSSTLGDMLVLSGSKKPITLEENGDSGSGQSLPRSKSLPELDRTTSEESTETAPGKSSLKWKVSNLFFSRSRKSGKDKTGRPAKDMISQPTVADETAGCKEYPREKMGSSISNAAVGCSTDNHEQPSPISVLDRSFEEDEKTIPSCSGMLGTSLIDKSPPIGSLARTLKLDDSYAVKASSHSFKTRTLPAQEEEEYNNGEDEQYWLLYIRTLLSGNGFKGKDNKWYSPNSPLDPSLRDKFVDMDDNTLLLLPEPNQRRIMSNRKLVFDCVNELIAEMMTNTGRDGAHKGLVSAERVWTRMKGWWFRAEGGGSGVERVVRYEMLAGRWWSESLRAEVESLVLEIERRMFRELVDDVFGDLSGRA